MLAAATWPAQAGAQSVQPAPSQASSIRITEQTHRITFGREILVTLQAQAGGDIVAVKGWFRPRGPDRISSYTYPSFQAGRSITAAFSIRTGDGAYYPPGTEFDYRFELTMADGSVFETPAQTVEYLDPRFGWKRDTRDALTAVFYNLPDATVDRLMDAASARLGALRAMTGAGAGQPYKAVLYRSVSDATPSFPPVSQTATDRQFFAGFAQPEYGLFVLGSPDSATFVHELTHLLVGQAVGSPLAASVPAWLNEGLATFAESFDVAGLNARIQSAASSSRLLKLRSMGTIPGRRSDIDLFYPQAGAFVGYLHGRFGADGLAELLRGIDAGRKVYDAAQDAWGVSLDDVENDWRASLGAQPLPVPSPTAAPAPSATPTAGETPTVAETASPAVAPAPAPVSTPEATEAGTPRPVSDNRAMTVLSIIYTSGLVVVLLVVIVIRSRRRRRGKV